MVWTRKDANQEERIEKLKGYAGELKKELAAGEENLNELTK